MYCVWIIATLILQGISGSTSGDEGGGIPLGTKTSGSDIDPSDLPGTNIAFELPDLTAIVETTSGLFLLEVYRSIGNDQIIRDMATGQSAELAKKSQLFWVSIGQTNFVKTPNPQNQELEIFHNTTSDFNTYIQMLTPTYRSALAGAAQTKYHIEVNDSQIVNLILQRFECVLDMYDENGDHFLLK